MVLLNPFLFPAGMASRPSKRLFVVVSVCLLLQQFSPAYAAHLSRDKHSKKSNDKKQHQGKVLKYRVGSRDLPRGCLRSEKYPLVKAHYMNI